MEPYFVYHNWRRERVRIHRGACRYCNGGQGVQPQSSRRDDEWLGPFEREAAFEAAKRLHRDDSAACATCRP